MSFYDNKSCFTQIKESLSKVKTDFDLNDIRRRIMENVINLNKKELQSLVNMYHKQGGTYSFKEELSRKDKKIGYLVENKCFFDKEKAIEFAKENGYANVKESLINNPDADDLEDYEDKIVWTNDNIEDIYKEDYEEDEECVTVEVSNVVPYLSREDLDYERLSELDMDEDEFLEYQIDNVKSYIEQTLGSVFLLDIPLEYCEDESSIEEYIADYLSDETGYLIDSFEWNRTSDDDYEEDLKNVDEGYTLLGNEDKNIEAYCLYKNAVKRAEELGLQLAEYGGVYGSDISYAYWNKSGDRNDSEEVICYYFFDENGKPKETITELELDKIADAYGMSSSYIDDADEAIDEDEEYYDYEDDYEDFDDEESLESLKESPNKRDLYVNDKYVCSSNRHKTNKDFIDKVRQDGKVEYAGEKALKTSGTQLDTLEVKPEDKIQVRKSKEESCNVKENLIKEDVNLKDVENDLGYDFDKLVKKNNSVADVYEDNGKLVINTSWRTTPRQVEKDRVDLTKFLDNKVGKDNYNLKYVRRDSRDNGKEFSALLELTLKDGVKENLIKEDKETFKSLQDKLSNTKTLDELEKAWETVKSSIANLTDNEANDLQSFYAFCRERRQQVKEDFSKEQIDKMIDKTLQNDGGTFDKNTGEDADKDKLKNKYLTAYKDKGGDWDKSIDKVDRDEVDNAFNKAQNNAKEDEFIGTWSDKDNSSVDVSKSFDDKEDAIKFGKENEQKAIGKFDKNGEYEDTIYIEKEDEKKDESIDESKELDKAKEKDKSSISIKVNNISDIANLKTKEQRIKALERIVKKYIKEQKKNIKEFKIYSANYDTDEIVLKSVVTESLKEEYPNDDSTITNDYWIRGWHFIVYPERQSRKYWLYRPDTDKSKAQGGQITYYGEGRPLEDTVGWDDIGNGKIPNDVLKKIVGIIYKNERRLKLWYDESIKESTRKSRDREKQELRDKGIGWVNGQYNKGTDEQERRFDELSCMDMLDSIIVYGPKFTSGEEVVSSEERSAHNYLSRYIKSLGRDRVVELADEQLKDIKEIGYAGEDSEGVPYNYVHYVDENLEEDKTNKQIDKQMRLNQKHLNWKKEYEKKSSEKKDDTTKSLNKGESK